MSTATPARSGGTRMAKPSVESYTITDMAHGTPLGIGDNDERYGAQGAFLIEAGISSSYHIANFFGLTEWIHLAAREAAKEVSKETAKETAKPIPASSSGRRQRAGSDEVLWPLATLNRRPEPEPLGHAPKRRGIDVGAVITRALTAAGLMK